MEKVWHGKAGGTTLQDSFYVRNTATLVDVAICPTHAQQARLSLLGQAGGGGRVGEEETPELSVY